MFSEYEKEIFKQLLEKYGIQSQSLQTAEECSELIKEVSKAVRMKIQGKPVSKGSLTEEIADVLIMIEQIKLFYGIDDDEIRQEIKFKTLSIEMEHLIYKE